MQQAKSRVTVVDEKSLVPTDPRLSVGSGPTTLIPAADQFPGIVPDPSVVADPVVVRSGTIVRVPVIDRLVPLLRLQMGLALVVLNLADVLLTKVLLGVGAIEANPIMAPIIGGTAAPIGTKTLIPAFAAALLVMCPVESKLADRAVATVLGVYVAIVLWNAALLAHLTL